MKHFKVSANVSDNNYDDSLKLMTTQGLYNDSVNAGKGYNLNKVLVIRTVSCMKN